jgi:Ca-activated chloride channel family protein
MNTFTSRKFVLIASLLAIALAGCAPAAAPAAPYQAPPKYQPPAQTQKSVPMAAAVTEAPAVTAAPYATEAPAAADAGAIQDSSAAQPLPAQPIPAQPQGNGPAPIVVGGNRAPVEPTSVAQPQTPVDTTFKDYGVNPFIDTARDHLSTFALDVDTASYAIGRNYVNQGILPPYETVRAEEYINYFVQDYTPPANNAFAIFADGAPSPFHRDGSYLLRIGVQGYDIPASQRKPAALTFVVDVSGSMNMESRLGTVKRSLQMLVERLRADDTVSIVVFGDTARVVLYPTSGADKNAILNAIYQLQPEGSTNTEAGLQLGYQMATQSYRAGGINRVILCSDGVGNVGTTDPIALINNVKGTAPADVMLTTIGFGVDNYNDVMMEQLANKGNGFYAYIDTLEEARKMFIDRLTNSLEAIAKDAKVQVDFNPEVVATYRLVGYENRAVADQDFRDDRVDAGELNAGHNSTAMYQVTLRPGAHGKIATVFLRWQDPNTMQTQELAGDVNTWNMSDSYEQASARFQMNAAVMQYAEILRRSPYTNMSLGELTNYAWQVARLLPQDADVQAYAQLVQRAATLR